MRKRDNSLRLCLDFRKVNSLTKKDAYPLPRMDDTLESLADSKYYVTLDCASGYWQVPVAEADRPETAFSTHRGLFSFVTMPMGLSCSGAMFERLMDKVLKKLVKNNFECNTCTLA